jgi:hypothetical protein
MMTRGSSILGHILTTYIHPLRRKKGDCPLVHREIYFKTNNSKATPPSQTACPPAFIAGAEVDVIDFESGEYDLMDDDTEMDNGNRDIVPTTTPKLKSTIMEGTFDLGDGDPKKTKRRGFRKEIDVEHNSLFVALK